MEAPERSLLSLPDLAVVLVVKCLRAKDKLCLASSCRRLAMAVSSASKGATVTVTSRTGWEGLRKVLSINTITCKTMICKGNPNSYSPSRPNNALDVLIKPWTVPGSCFKGIQKLVLDEAGSLPCLLPPRLARILPDLTELHIMCRELKFRCVEPISFCTSLRSITFTGLARMLQLLPRDYHTAEDLRRQMPNVDTLVLSSGSNCECGYTMIEAWGDQLTKLDLGEEISRNMTPHRLQYCTRLQSLIWRCYPSPAPLSFLPPYLTHLGLKGEIEESIIESVLLHPLIRTLTIGWFSNSLQKDWSNHPCSWTQLAIDKLHMADLSKLPLHSLKGPACLNVQILELPDPSLPDSLAVATVAAECISNAGFSVGGCFRLECQAWYQVPASSAVDKASATLVDVAARVVTPSVVSFSPASSHFPLTMRAIIRWLSPVVQTLSFARMTDAPPWLWDTLQCCNSLRKVEFTIKRYSDAINGDVWHTVSIGKIVQLAAEKLVKVASRPVVLTMTYELTPSDHIQPLRQLRKDIQERLPSSVRVEEFTWAGGSLLTIQLGPGTI